MPPLKIGIQLRSLGLPLRRALAAARELGAESVEIDARGEVKPQEMVGTALRQFRKLLDDLGLRVSAVGFRTRRGYQSEEQIEQRIEATQAAMRFAHSLGAPGVVNQIGRVPAEPKGREWDLLTQSLSELGRQGNRLGALLSAETGSESGPDLARLIAALPPGSLTVTLNPGNLIINGFSPLEAIAAVGPHITLVHVKDGVRDLAQGRGVEVPLGRGSADWPALLGALEDHSYRGPLIIERERAEDPVQEVGQAIQYLKSL